MSISEFKAVCLRIIERIRRGGESLLVTKNGEPAVIVSPASAARHQPGPFFGKMREEGEVVGDIVSPLTDVKWDAMS